MKCKYCKQYISFFEWCFRYQVCFYCWQYRQEEFRDRYNKEESKKEKTSKTYWKNKK